MTQQVNDTIAAKTRLAGNKGVARKLRRAGSVPAVAYGPSDAPRFLALDPKSFIMQRRHFGLSHIYSVDVEGEQSFKALIKEIQQDAVTRALLHVDLRIIDMSKPIKVVVPIELTGKPAGLIEGGLLSQVLRSTEVQCLPNDVPGKILADVAPLKVGDSLHLSDLKLPEGVKLTSTGDEAVALVVEPDAAPAPTAAEAAAAPVAAAAKPADKK
jgi:large subunit ribosomal protein L25